MFKWTGSKKWLRHNLKEVDEVVEMFAGSAWVSFSRSNKCHLNDTCLPLIAVYEQLMTNKASFLFDVERQFLSIQNASDPRATYNSLRTKFNITGSDPVLFCVLLHAGFNGLWRTSTKGFNVPYGGVRKLDLSTLDSIPVEKIVTLSATSWEDVHIPNEKCLIYADPPYVGTHTIYTKEGWDHLDNQNLVAHLSDIKNPTMFSLLNTDFNLKLIKKNNFLYAEKERTFRNGVSTGKRVKELICFNEKAHSYLKNIQYILQ